MEIEPVVDKAAKSKEEDISTTTILAIVLLFITLYLAFANYKLTERVDDLSHLVTPVVVIDPASMPLKEGYKKDDYMRDLDKVVNFYVEKGYVVLNGSTAVLNAPENLIISLDEGENNDSDK